MTQPEECAGPPGMPHPTMCRCGPDDGLRERLAARDAAADPRCSTEGCEDYGEPVDTGGACPECGLIPWVPDALDAALAEVGRLIEEAPWRERHDAVDAFLKKMSESDRRNLIVGVFIRAHERRLHDDGFVL